MTTTKSTVQFSQAEENDVVAYRPLSHWALAAFLLGCLSATALAQPVLWIVPLLGAVTALYALRVIGAEKELAGRNLALLGLVLSLMFATWGPSRVTSRQQMLYDQARPFSQQWLEMVMAGDYYEAYELHLSPPERQPPGTDLAELYGFAADAPGGPLRGSATPGFENPEAHLIESRKQGFRNFFGVSPLSDMVAAEGKGTLRFEENVWVARRAETRSDTILQKYVFDFENAGERKALDLWISLTRFTDRQGQTAIWKIAHVANAPPD